MSSSNNTVAVVLAAGQGTRMRSELPKVLHSLSGRTLVSWAVGAALEGGANECVVVVGHGREAVESDLEARYPGRVRFAFQEEQRGTGHAVRCALEQALPDFEGQLLVTYGDCPLVTAETLRALFEAGAGRDCAILVATKKDPKGYGRMLRKDGVVVGIREHKDCSPEELLIHEVNPGLYCFDAKFAADAIARLNDNNAQGELYLTDLIAMAESVADIPGDMDELRGVNDRFELAQCGDILRRRILEGLARSGVGILDLETTNIGADCQIQPGATIHAGVHLRGKCRVAGGAVIDVGSILTDVSVATGAHLQPYSVAAESAIGPSAKVGPFSHLRPHTKLAEGAKVGNFCETKKTSIGKNSKVNHLAYVGDGMIGEGVNIGAGVIFCNYDGVNKNVTTLEDGVFIGSDSQLVAPITVGKGAYVASGSTITKDVPADALALSRTKQQNKEGYATRLRARMEAAKKRG
ncbi:MAG: bifunctional UDP-N-acetylglucosamine pyrophosphorylase/glucosamine-1-phosphate N-acetyltransferase [Polyangiales bacterium]|jgi:bifunctional UDP-N-acetylglucosamine pyrophosphorylase/glucosamine-1-phosphate N-acetyltransferase